MTYDGTTRRNLQDGVIITEVADPAGPIATTTDPLRIGDDVRWDRSPNGRIDDVRIWNVARTQAEIQAGMNGVAATTPGLVADWTFDNGSLTDVASGLTGALVGDVHLAGDNATQRNGDADSDRPPARPRRRPAQRQSGAPRLRPARRRSRSRLPPATSTATDTSPSGMGRPCWRRWPAFTSHIGVLAPFCNDGNAMIDGHPARDDANCDNAVNVLDVLAIFKQVALLTQLPASCQGA